MRVTSPAWQTDLALLRLAGSEITDRGDHLVVRTPANPTYRWGNFVLFGAPPAPGAAGGWLDTFTRELPAVTHVTLGIDDPDTEWAGDPGFTEAGVTVIGYTILTARALREPPAPAVETALRPLAGDADWAQAIALRRVTDAASTEEEHTYIDRRLGDIRAMCERGEATWFGAFVEGTLAATLGIAVTGPRLARYRDVETHPAHRRRGLARALVHCAGTHALSALGAETLVILADPDYHAIDLYRSLGFTAAGRQVQLERLPAS